MATNKKFALRRGGHMPTPYTSLKNKLKEGVGMFPPPCGITKKNKWLQNLQVQVYGSLLT